MPYTFEVISALYEPVIFICLWIHRRVNSSAQPFREVSCYATCTQRRITNRHGEGGTDPSHRRVIAGNTGVAEVEPRHYRHRRCGLAHNTNTNTRSTYRSSCDLSGAELLIVRSERMITYTPRRAVSGANTESDADAGASRSSKLLGYFRLGR